MSCNVRGRRASLFFCCTCICCCHGAYAQSAEVAASLEQLPSSLFLAPVPGAKRLRRLADAAIASAQVATIVGRVAFTAPGQAGRFDHPDVREALAKGITSACGIPRSHLVVQVKAAMPASSFTLFYVARCSHDAEAVAAKLSSLSNVAMGAILAASLSTVRGSDASVSPVTVTGIEPVIVSGLAPMFWPSAGTAAATMTTTEKGSSNGALDIDRKIEVIRDNWKVVAGVGAAVLGLLGCYLHSCCRRCIRQCARPATKPRPAARTCRSCKGSTTSLTIKATKIDKGIKSASRENSDMTDKSQKEDRSTNFDRGHFLTSSEIFGTTVFGPMASIDLDKASNSSDITFGPTNSMDVEKVSSIAGECIAASSSFERGNCANGALEPIAVKCDF